MKVVCTLCSREKNKRDGLLPASKRYSSNRVKVVLDISGKKKLPLYYLSGKYGLVKSDDEIPYYDLLLLPNAVELLSKLVFKQLKNHDITHVLFYVKSKFKKKNKPYYDVIEKACKSADIKLETAKLKI